MEPVTPPRRTGRTMPVNITGYLVPFHENNQPFLIQIPGSKHMHVVCFSTPEKLEAAKRFIRFPKTKQILDGREFIASLPLNQPDETGSELKVAIDPYITTEGKTRYLELQFD
jgi:hypothetical protein